QPEAHAIAADMRALAEDYGERTGRPRVLIGEIFLPNAAHACWFGTPDRPEVHLPFNFQLIENAWDADVLRRVIADYLASLPEWGWPNWVFGSHDAPRIAARIGEPQARVAAMLLLTLRGTPTLYQGDEIAIGDAPIRPDRIRDPQHFRQPTLNIGRDRSRTPIPWDARAFAGFSTVEPWLPLNPDWPTRNVAAQDNDRSSMLWLYRRLLATRRETPALAVGGMQLLDAPTGVLAYRRTHADGDRTIVLNLTAGEAAFDWAGRVMLSTLDSPASPGRLRPNEGLVLA
ncbi:MAG TPA: alpha-amylase family glycosyl hydrolase, partial [Sphingomonas sp.]|nr:alpha-amylase family glycosyl hydrolase [Sphingomonas sp.]